MVIDCDFFSTNIWRRNGIEPAQQDVGIEWHLTNKNGNLMAFEHQKIGISI